MSGQDKCLGCGSTKTLDELQAEGFLSCCPDRPGASSFVEMGTVKMIDRLAGAVCGARNKYFELGLDIGSDFDFDVYVASAVLQAIREPTQFMLDAVCSDDRWTPFTDDTVRSLWRDMIGAALSEAG